MSEPPADPTPSPERNLGGAVEHPVDAAARGAHRGPPVPQPPTPRALWGWRPALLIPAAIGAVGVYRHTVAPFDTGRLVLAAVQGAALLLFLGLGWWAAAQPRLTDLEAGRVHSELSLDARKRLQRALRRGDDLPAELRPWAPAYLASSSGWSTLVPGFAMSTAPANVLLTSSRPDSPSIGDVILTALLALMLLAVLAASAVAQRMRRHARLLRDSSPSASAL